MLRLRKLFSLENVKHGFGDVVSRFPIATLVMAVFTCLFIVNPDFIKPGTSAAEETAVYLGLVIAAYVSVCWVLASEANKADTRPLVQLIIVSVIVGLSWFAEQLGINLILALVAVLLILGNAAFWRQPVDNGATWNFTHLIWTAALFAFVGSVIFFIGMHAISHAFSSLFGLDVYWLTSTFILPVGLGFLAPLYWLSTIPRTSDDVIATQTEPEFISRAIGFIGTWLLVPMMLIYTLILFAYCVKLLLDQSLPSNEVAELVYPYVVFGTLTWLVLDAPIIRNGKIASGYKRIWFYAVLPVALLLAIVIGVRVKEYGLTTDRVLIIACVVWISVLGGYYAFSRVDSRNIRYIPGVAALLILLVSIFASPLSYRDQLSRAKQYLVSAGIQSPSGEQLWRNPNYNNSALLNSKLDDARKARGALRFVLYENPEKAKAELFSGVNFSEVVQSASNELDGQIGNQEGSIEFEMQGDLTDYMRASIEQDAIIRALGLDSVPVATHDSRIGENQYVSFDNTNFSASISEFDTLHRYGSFQQNNVFLGGGSVSYRLSKNGYTYSLMKDDTVLASVDLRQWALSQRVENNQLVVPSPLIPLYEEGDQRVSLLLRQLHIELNKNAEYAYFDFDILTRGI